MSFDETVFTEPTPEDIARREADAARRYRQTMELDLPQAEQARRIRESAARSGVTHRTARPQP